MRRAQALLVSLALVGCADDDAPPQPRFMLALDLTGAARDALRATAVLYSPFVTDGGDIERAADGTPLSGPCGLTFVDRHRAITAAHCVPPSSFPTATDTIAAKFIDIDTSVDWRAAATLHGTFPAWTHGTIGQGYTTTDFTCRVSRRCGTGPIDCPAGSETTDVAVLACDLPEDRTPIGLAPADAPSAGPVTIFWYREIYDEPTEQPLAQDFHDHYTSLALGEAQNYHYLAGRNQLLPVMPRAFDDGALPSRLGEDIGLLWTDLYSCHGTSGSGVLQLGASGRYELLGPTSEGRFDDLCADPHLARGTKNLGYPAPASVHAVVDAVAR